MVLSPSRHREEGVPAEAVDGTSRASSPRKPATTSLAIAQVAAGFEFLAIKIRPEMGRILRCGWIIPLFLLQKLQIQLLRLLLLLAILR